MPRARIRLVRPLESTEVWAAYADTPVRRACGLQAAPAEEVAAAVMLLDFGREVLPRVHMRNVAASLEVAFVRADGLVTETERLPPDATVWAVPTQPSRYVIETGGRAAERLRVAVGDRLTVVEIARGRRSVYGS